MILCAIMSVHIIVVLMPLPFLTGLKMPMSVSFVMFDFVL